MGFKSDKEYLDYKESITDFLWKEVSQPAADLFNGTIKAATVATSLYTRHQ